MPNERTFCRSSIVCFVVVALWVPLLAEKLSWEAQISYRFTLNLGRDSLDHQPIGPGKRLGNELFAAGGLRWSPLGWLALRTSLNTGEVSVDAIKNGTFKRRVRSTFFIDEAYVEFLPGNKKWVRTRLGQERVQAGGGLVFDGNTPNVSLNADLQMISEVPLIVKLHAAQLEEEKLFTPGRRSHFLEAELGIPFSFFEEIALYACYFLDRENSFGSIVPLDLGVLVEKSTTRFWWIGFKGNKITTKQIDFEWNGLVNFGKVNGSGIYFGPNFNLYELFQANFPVFGWAGNLGVTITSSNSWQGSWFFLAVSGDKKAYNHMKAGTRVKSFFSMRPFVIQPELFFNGGISTELRSYNTSLLGRKAKGVLCTGLAWKNTFAKQWEVETVSSFLTTCTDDIRIYGPEQDISVQWTRLERLAPVLKLGIFKPVDPIIFPNQKPIFLANLGLDFVF